MSEPKKKRLSREEIANIEVGHSEITKAQQWAVTGFFVLFIGIYPCAQMFSHQPFAEWRPAENVQQAIKNYERAIEDTSLLRRALLSVTQRFLTGVLRTGNEKVIVGDDGWLFFSGDYEYLINSGFLRPEILKKRLLKGGQPDPCKAILDFNRQLQARGIRLILLPVPVKPMIYADKLGGTGVPLQNPSFAEFKARLETAGVTVIDLADELGKMRCSGNESYLKTDTHWTPAAMMLAALRIATTLDNRPVLVKGEPSVRDVTNTGDIAAMLKLPECEKFFPPETVSTVEGIHPERSSDVLLLGDSFANIFSAEVMKWGENSGLAEAIGLMLNRPVDAILRNDAGAFATRQLLANELKRGRDRLAGKKAVVWEFACRELANGDWKMLDMALGKVPEAKFLVIDKPRTVKATVLAVSQVPRPFSAPYKDHVMSIHLADIDGGDDQALVYAASMRDNKWTDAAKLRAGDTVVIQLTPWSAHEAEYGSWNRSEFSDEELLLADPAWGELPKPQPETK